ncbi:putative epidermal growth factor, partial [Trypoxylus dichotomus]
ERETIVIEDVEYDEHGSWTTVRKCCPSYSEVDGHCLPLCDPPCDHGECIDVNKCKCEKDYTGPSCSILICPPGNIGIDCKEDCPENTFGSNCEGKCSCKNGICDRVTGKCKCDSGWSGLE